MALEREGLEIKVIKALAKEMKLPISEVYEIIGVPRSTAEKKATGGGMLDGAPGHAALALLRLLGKAHGIVDDSTDPAAASFETTRWLGEWIRKPQPPLGGRAPVELLDTPTGAESVMRVLGALESGAYQ